jgi:hypothetical protein
MESTSPTVERMGGQVLGGGVIVLVAVALWMVYLLPSWYQRHQFNAAERNALRLNQALRVLAETSETPDEVQWELNARTALAQQRAARRAQAERERLAHNAQAERDAIARKAQAERERLAHQAQAERVKLAQKSQAEREQLATRAAEERERAELDRQQVALEIARRERAAAHALPEARRARARRRARRMTLAVWVLALVLATAGVGLSLLGTASVPLWARAFSAGAPAALWIAGGMTLLAVLLTVTTARMRARERSRTLSRPRDTAEPERAVVAFEPVELAEPREWSPRELPRPLTASAGSRAAAVLDGVQARETLRRAALEESIRERAERRRPPSIDAARAARAASEEDAAMEAHVRDLLARRAASA